MKSTKWEKEDLISIINSSLTKAEVLRKLGFKGFERGNYRTLNKYIKNYNLDTSHFLGQRWNRGSKFEFKKSIPIENMLIENSQYSTSTIRRRIRKENIIPYVCSECNLSSVWNNKPISLQLDHINGEHTDNRLENLRFLCPNCHSQTETHGRSKASMKHSLCNFCKSKCKKKSHKYCSDKCYHNSTKFVNSQGNLKTRKVERPSKEELKEMIDTMSYCAIGRKYNVSDNAIRKWAKCYELI